MLQAERAELWENGNMSKANWRQAFAVAKKIADDPLRTMQNERYPRTFTDEHETKLGLKKLRRAGFDRDGRVPLDQKEMWRKLMAKE